MTVCPYCGGDPCELEQERDHYEEVLFGSEDGVIDQEQRYAYLERCRSVIARLERLHEEAAA